MAKKVRLFSWNVNGIRAAARKGLLDWLRRESPDVLCLQETKAEPSQLDEALLRPEGYRAEFCWAQKKGYSGVATYAKAPAVRVERGLGVPEYDAEGRVLVHDFPEFRLYNVYFPNGKASPERLRYKLRFYDDFLKALKKDLKRGERVVVCGDVNTAHRELDLARPRENSRVSGFLPEERAWIDRLLQAGFADTFRQFETGPGHYTWWDQVTRARERNVGWRIDYFFVSDALRPRLKGAAIHDGVMGSDHCPISVEFKF
ncbi:MAG: exodeoxyribonuclease III [Elusimicrobia bacterium GWA2_69_24]|nr:MAG: exodeoxyribonuclease III [Elusimicrobia bacterium GWA2_69_24]